MSTETLKVLEMLEEGKISTDEAERLIKALTSSRSGRKVKREARESVENISRTIAGVMDHVKEHIARAVPDDIDAYVNFGKEFGKESKFDGTYPAKKSVSLSVGRGDVSLSRSDDDKVHVKSSRSKALAIRSKDDKLTIKIGRGDTELKAPDDLNFSIKIGNGDLNVEDGKADNFEAKIGMGDIIGKIAAENANFAVGKGDLSFTLTSCKDGKLNVGKGDVNLEMPFNATLSIDVSEKADVFLDDRLTIESDDIIESNHSKDNRRKILAKIGDGAEGDIGIAIGFGDLSIS